MLAAWPYSLQEAPEIGASPVALLGALVSGPPLAPYGLIRRARRRVFGRGTLYLEAMLCDSDLVEAVSKDGVELVHEFRVVAQRALREHVMVGEIPVEELRAACRCEHLELSPLLFLEEQLVWAYISQPDPGPECNNLLSDCLLSIVRENRHQILDWAAGALLRLPDLVVNTQAAWLLSELCNAMHRETRKVAPPPVEQVEPGLLQELSPLFPQILVGFYRDGATLTLGPIGRLRRTAFVVPGIALRPVTVTWTDTEYADTPSEPDDASGHDQDGRPQRQQHEVTVDATDFVSGIPVGGSAIQLHTVAGAVISLQSFEPGTMAPELVELDKSLDLMEDAWRNGRSVTAIVMRTVSAVGVIVRFVDAWAIRGHLRFERSYLEETGTNLRHLVGADINVRISSFERHNQRILCRLAPPEPWSAGVLVPGMEVEVRFRRLGKFGFYADVPTTEQGFKGPTITGLAHISQLPGSWADRINSLRPGDLLRLKVFAVDRERRRLNLGASEETADALASLSEGAVLTGRVVKIVPFGVFIEILPGIDALLHNSEIAAQQVPEVGAEMRVRVIGVDRERSRVSLATEPRLATGTPFRVPGPKPRASDRESTAVAPVSENIVFRRYEQQRHVVAEFLRERLRQANSPEKLATLAAIVNVEFGIASNWLGYGKFKDMLNALVPEARIDNEDSGRVHPL